MANEKIAKKVSMWGKSLSCPICHHDKFWQRDTLLNSRVATFFKFDWANKSAQNYICDQCGHILWFVEK